MIGYKAFGLMIVGSMLLASCDQPPPTPAPPQSSEEEHEVEEPIRRAFIGEVLKGNLFEYTVKAWKVLPRVRTGYSVLPAHPGNQYVMLRIAATNIGNEAQEMTDGVLWLRSGGKQYAFNQSEMVGLQGWGFDFQPINPLVTEERTVVWKVPSDVRGQLFWQPVGEGSSTFVEVGTLPWVAPKKPAN